MTDEWRFVFVVIQDSTFRRLMALVFVCVFECCQRGRGHVDVVR